ncbi:tetratricopeptide repeat protein [Saccharothrix xinjiangensis]|uniref:Tetratricopeptide repeat protein n=1 Tax=Saccharothrix xinjiangensis TaxID=204798 RepID=A0ABV9XXT9_9PSEU
MAGRSWWRFALGVVVAAVVVSLSTRFGMPGWLLTDEHPVRNVLEGLSWPAGVLALVLMIAPPVRRWFSAPRPADAVNPLVGRALHLVDGRLPGVSEVGLLELGIKPAVDTSEEGGLDLPPYVGRDVDEDLEWAVAEGGLVLLHGRAAAGKSRTAVEALRRLRPDNPLLVPEDGAKLRELADLVDLADAVIWLDDLERYLGPGGLDLGLLQRLCPDRSRTAVVATMRDEELARHTGAAVARDFDVVGIDRAAAELLARVQGRRRIAVAPSLGPAEEDRALAVPDGRVRRAVEAPEGFAEHLAAGVAMMDRWAIGDGPLFLLGQALVSAAVDCRRAGHHEPVPTSLLEEVHRHYLPPAWRDRNDLPPIAEALAWAHRPVLGASSCLQPRPGGTHLASDYLLDRTQSGQSPLTGPVRAELWPALLAATPPWAAIAIGYAAYGCEELEVAERAYRRAVAAGRDEALFPLGLVLKDQGRSDEAEATLRRAVGQGDHEARSSLGVLLWQVGRLVEAEVVLRRAVEEEEEDEFASMGLAMVLFHLERFAEAEEVLRRSAELRYPRMMRLLGSLLEIMDRPQEAEVWLRRAAEAGFGDQALRRPERTGS